MRTSAGAEISFKELDLCVKVILEGAEYAFLGPCPLHDPLLRVSHRRELARASPEPGRHQRILRLRRVLKLVQEDEGIRGSEAAHEQGVGAQPKLGKPRDHLELDGSMGGIEGVLPEDVGRALGHRCLPNRALKRKRRRKNVLQEEMLRQAFDVSL
jgi:hypothetical protein